MTTEVLAQSLLAGVQATFGAGRIWYLKSASAPVTITCEQYRSGASVRKFINVAAGFKFKADPDDGWVYLRMLSALAQNIEIIIGDDDVEVANAVTVSGGVFTNETPSSAFATTVAETALGAASSANIAANLSRRRITVNASSTNTASLWIRDQAAITNGGIELQPGLFVELKTTAAFRIRNNSAGAQSYSLTEET